MLEVTSFLGLLTFFLVGGGFDTTGGFEALDVLLAVVAALGLVFVPELTTLDVLVEVAGGAFDFTAGAFMFVLGLRLLFLLLLLNLAGGSSFLGEGARSSFTTSSFSSLSSLSSLSSFSSFSSLSLSSSHTAARSVLPFPSHSLADSLYSHS